MLWKLFVALSLIGITKYADHIENCPQGNYACPTICDVDHKHHPREECNGKAKQESKSDTTTVQSVKQFYKEAVGTDKSEGV
jgi:hypothetical protein